MLAQDSEAQREEYENAAHRTSIMTLYVREMHVSVPVAKSEILIEEKHP
jgi:hypothetical protein